MPLSIANIISLILLGITIIIYGIQLKKLHDEINELEKKIK